MDKVPIIFVRLGSTGELDRERRNTALSLLDWSVKRYTFPFPVKTEVFVSL